MSTLTTTNIRNIAAKLDAAELTATAIPMLTEEFPRLGMEDGYAVQDAIKAIKTERGNSVVGLKMGFTSLAKMRQMNCDSPIRANLFDYFALPDDGEFPVSQACHPRVEAEIAFVLKKALRGPNLTVDDVLAATDFVVPALEIIDSRYQDFKFDLPSVVADNASSCRFVVGSQPMPVTDKIDLSTLGVALRKNGHIVEMGAGAAVLNHPARAIAMLAAMLAEKDEAIPAGTFILSGGITAAVAVQPGDYIQGDFQYLGTTGIRFN